MQRRASGGAACTGPCQHRQHSWKAGIRIDGREYTKSYSRKSDAEAWLKGMRAQKALVESGRQPMVSAPNGKKLLADIHDEVLQAYEDGVLARRRHTEATLRSYRSELRLLVEEFPRVPLSRISERVVDEYHTKLARAGKSASVIRRRLDRLAQALEWSVRRGYIPSMPCEVRRPAPAPAKEVVVAPDAWVQRMVEAARGLSPEHLALVLLYADAGLRRSEPWLLRRRDVRVYSEPDPRQFHGWLRLEVRGGEERTKSGLARNIPMLTARIAETLRWFAGDSDDRLLPSLDRASFASRHDRVRRMMRTLWRRSGLQAETGKHEAQFHALRHRFGTWVLEERLGTIVEVQAWMGHSVITTTQRYLHARTRPGIRPGHVHSEDEQP